MLPSDGTLMPVCNSLSVSEIGPAPFSGDEWSTSGEPAACPSVGGRLTPFRRSWMTTGSPRTGVTRHPARAASASMSSFVGGSEKATANVVPSNWSGTASYSRATTLGRAAMASALSSTAAMSIAGRLARWARAPTTTPGKASPRLMSNIANDWFDVLASATRGARLACVS